MSNPFENLENKLIEQQVIEVLDSRTFDDPEALEFLRKYVDQCHTEADAEAQADPESAVTSI